MKGYLQDSSNTYENMYPDLKSISKSQAGPKKSAEDRFNELTSQGVSDDDAYAIMRKEGYK